MTNAFASPQQANDLELESELEWLGRVLSEQLRLSVQNIEKLDLSKLPPPLLGHSWYHQFVHRLCLPLVDRLALIMALAPHLSPLTLNTLLTGPAQMKSRGEHKSHGGVVVDGILYPTLETLAWTLNEQQVEARFAILRLFLNPMHPFAQERVLYLAQAAPGSLEGLSLWHRRLCVNPEFLERLFMGNPTYQPR